MHGHSPIGKALGLTSSAKCFPPLLRSALRTFGSVTDPVYDLAVVGGGIVGLACAREMVRRHADLRVVVLEKEAQLGTHQTGRNSGVVHAGIYYQPGSLRARLCVEGHAASLRYCAEEKIPCKEVGKLVVATDEQQRQRLHDLFQRARQNQVPDLQLVRPSEMQRIAPGVAGLEAIWSPHTAIVDWRAVALSFARQVKSKAGCDIRTNFELVAASKHCSQAAQTGPDCVELWSQNSQRVLAKHVVTCSGLHSDRVWRMLDQGLRAAPGTAQQKEQDMVSDDDIAIVPVRGSYWRLTPSAREQGLVPFVNIYPVPDPRYPWLGVHFTPTIDGEVLIGPNAALAGSKENYTDRAGKGLDWKEAWMTLTHPGFLRFAFSNVRFGLKEMYFDQNPKALMPFLQRYIPMLRPEHVLWKEADGSRRSGIRAQLIKRSGEAIDDFVFKSSPACLHVLNAPSPGATSCLAIARVVADRASAQTNPQCCMSSPSLSIFKELALRAQSGQRFFVVNCASVGKGSSLVTLSFPVRKDQEILLNYVSDQETKITTTRRDAYPLWIAEAAAPKRFRITVWSLEKETCSILFVVQEENYPLPLKSVSLATSEKEDLLDSISASGTTTRELTKSLSLPED
eukprot:g18300.t1